jgi:hypothetical protein
MMRKLLVYVLLAGVVYFFYNNQTTPDKAATNQKPEAATTVDDELHKKEKAKSRKASKKETPKTSDGYDIASLKAMESYKTSCNTKITKLNVPVKSVAQELEAQRISYDPAKLADCSGIFHRFLEGFKDECPGHDLPTPQKNRDARALAKWYQEKGMLTLIYDEAAQQELIKPGAVLFYGYPGKKYKNFKAEELFVRGTGIDHVGVVVEVERDAKGKIKNYHLFHGRNPRHPAGITKYHYFKPGRDSYPPLGNGSQQWVAFAPLVEDIVK